MNERVEPPTTDSNDCVPESLLAFAKDHRYIQQCQSLLQQIAEANHLPRSFDPSAWYLSSLLYSWLVIFERKRTLGMEACDLTFENSSRWKIVAAFVGSATLHYIASRLAEPCDTHETLRGSARRRFYELQRQAMLRGEPKRQVIPSQMRSMVSSVAKSIHEALTTARGEGPHRIRASGEAVSSLPRWILRFQLAYYCLGGSTHATLGHWLWGLKLQRNSKSSLLQSRPSNYRMVGALIAMETMVSLLEAVSRVVAKWVVSRLKTSPPSRRRLSASLPSSDLDENEESSGTCAICRMDRLHPAASSSCGHVFCWNCWMQWLSTVRPECPYCRTPCQKQDVVALYQYAAPTTHDF